VTDTQLDRIERKLDDLLALRDLLLKAFMPRIPAAGREGVLKLMARRGGDGG
jgi:hypothetical protein